jgi:hypothetical protein
VNLNPVPSKTTKKRAPAKSRAGAPGGEVEADVREKRPGYFSIITMKWYTRFVPYP